MTSVAIRDADEHGGLHECLYRNHSESDSVRIERPVGAIPAVITLLSLMAAFSCSSDTPSPAPGTPVSTATVTTDTALSGRLSPLGPSTSSPGGWGRVVRQWIVPVSARGLREVDDRRTHSRRRLGDSRPPGEEEGRGTVGLDSPPFPVGAFEVAHQ